MSEHQKTAVIDLDNTLAGYDKWRGEKVIGPIVPYAKDAVTELIEWGWRVVVFTTRGNRRLVKEWLVRNGLGALAVNSTRHNPPNTSSKPIADVYFDDRDAHCVGTMPYNWHRAMARVRKRYRPRLDTHIDDASLWANWWTRYLVAPRTRREFAKDLHLQMDLIALRSEGKDDVEEAYADPFGM